MVEVHCVRWEDYNQVWTKYIFLYSNELQEWKGRLKVKQDDQSASASINVLPYANIEKQ